MSDIIVAGHTLEEWRQKLPLLPSVMDMEEVFWTNPGFTPCRGREITPGLGLADIDEAEERLKRFAPYLAAVFPETGKSGGIIESELKHIPAMKQRLEDRSGFSIPGGLYVKCDGHLPVSGSVKARGGIYEVLKAAEEIALASGMLRQDDGYAVLAERRFRDLFARHSVIVGSTGNLGLSIGIMGARLGFRAAVHMSGDAKQWKKDLLRAKGAVVVEHESDYGAAVAAGRKEAKSDPGSHFVDDENSSTLFLGYAVAAKRLRAQMEAAAIPVDLEHPLFVYLPCGVGGAPGGITFGLRTVFGDAVHCFFAEPTHSPSMLLGLMTEKHDAVSVRDFGIDNVTEADGLACGRPSGFVGRALERDISGAFTVQDEALFRLLAALADTEGVFLEPSALAAFPGPARLFACAAGREYLEKRNLSSRMAHATHVLWATGGGMVPEEVMKGFYARGRKLLAE